MTTGTAPQGRRPGRRSPGGRAAAARRGPRRARRARGERDLYASEIRAAQTRYDELAKTAPKEFDDSGMPRQGTRAAKLRHEIDRAASSSWSRVIEGAGERVMQLEAEPAI